MAVTIGSNTWNISQGDGYKSTGGPNADVRAFQQELVAAGYNVAVDGIYGPATQNAYNQYMASEGADGGGSTGGATTAAEDREYINLPGQPEIWKVDDGSYRIVYYVPGTDPPVPVAYSADEKEVQAAFGPDFDIQVDKEVDEAELKSLGVLNFGTRAELANVTGDPIAALLSEIEKQADVRPWLADEGVIAVMLEATLENRQPTEAEFQGTDWWQEHNDRERDWLLLEMADPTTAAQTREDNRTTVRSQFQAAGIHNPPARLVNYFADAHTIGGWSDIELAEQITALADPSSPYKLRSDVQDFITEQEFSIDTTQEQEDTVQALVSEWLGPKYGAWDDEKIQKWAGRLRNDPDAEQQLVEMLRRRRMAVFGEYTNPDLTYEDIASGWRAEYEDVLGGLPDETDQLFVKAMRGNDTEAARTQFAEHGVRTKNTKVISDMREQLAAQFEQPGQTFMDV